MRGLIVFLTAFLFVEGLLNNFCSKNEKSHIEVLIRPPPVIEVEIGSPVSVVCAAHGHGMADPFVYWVKGLGPDFEDKGKQLGPIAIGKSTLYYERVAKEDIDTYQCIIEDCCSYKKIVIDIDIKVPDETCEDVYGVGNVIYGATWVFTNWTQAVASCEAKGMEIGFPSNAAENAQILTDIQASFNTHPNANTYAHENWVWIGGNDIDQEGLWKVATTGEPVPWKNFQKGQPDNWTSGGKYPEGQNCIGMSRMTGEWDDSYMHYKRPYVCLCPEDKPNVKTKNGKSKKNGK